MDFDWHRAASGSVIFGCLLASLIQGDARLILATIGLLAWPFVFIWFAEDLSQTTGLHWGLVDRPSHGGFVRAFGWVLLVTQIGMPSRDSPVSGAMLRAMAILLASQRGSGGDAELAGVGRRCR